MSLEDIIYMDYAAAVPVLPEVREKYAVLCDRYPANPHASSIQSEEARRAVLRCEQEVLELLGIPSEQAYVVWTSGGTEAANLACLGYLRRNGGACVVENAAHSAVLEPCRRYQTESGESCIELPVDRAGRLRLNNEDNETTGLVALCHVNNETGTVQDIEELRNWMRRNTPRAALAVDALQSFGRMEVPWERGNIDLLCLGGRKIGGPASTGALVCRAGVEIEPVFFGGGQQDGLRPGTMDVTGICGFTQALRCTVENRDSESRRITALNGKLRHRICTELAAFRPRIVSPTDASAHILAAAFPGYQGAVLVRALAQMGIVAGAGSACVSESKQHSHVMQAMGYGEETARGMLRFSFGYNSREEHIEKLITALHDILRNYPA